MKLATFRHEGKTSGGPILGGRIIERPAAQPNLPRHMIALLSASEKDRTAGFNFQAHILALRQQGSTHELLHEYLSTAFTLEVGDLIATGTPADVGILMQPPRFLKAGDVVGCETEGPGYIENIVWPESSNRSLS